VSVQQGKERASASSFKGLGRLAPFLRPQFRQTAVEVIIVGDAGLPIALYPSCQLVLEVVEFVPPPLLWNGI